MTSPWAEFGAIALAHALAVISPGPDFALVLRQSLRAGRRAAVWTSLGIGSGILVHSAYTVIGLGLVLRNSPGAFTVLKIAGATYLGWIGLQSMRSTGSKLTMESGEVATPSSETVSAAWLQGFLTNVLNPKAALFFIALFPAVVAAQTPRWIQAGYGLWMASTTAVWFSLVALVFTQEAVRRRFLRASIWIDRGLGVVFLAFAFGVALTVRE
jgi:RhtB (resistance to homoserine/threonine) family protein